MVKIVASVPGSIPFRSTIAIRYEGYPEFKVLHCSTEAQRQSQRLGGRRIALLAPSNLLYGEKIDVKKDFFVCHAKSTNEI